MTGAAVKIETGMTLDEAVRAIGRADNDHNAARIETMNALADGIIARGGITANLDEFTLAMHGYKPDFTGAVPDEHQETYENYQRLVNRLGDRWFGDLFALFYRLDNVPDSVGIISPVAVPDLNFGNSSRNAPLCYKLENQSVPSVVAHYVGKVMVPVAYLGGFYGERLRNEPERGKLMPFYRAGRRGTSPIGELNTNCYDTENYAVGRQEIVEAMKLGQRDSIAEAAGDLAILANLEKHFVARSGK